MGGQAPPADRPANVIATYGMTETGSGVVYDGVALDGVEVRIADGRGDPAPGADAPAGLPGRHRPTDRGRLVPHRRPRPGRRRRAARSRAGAGDLIITGGENVWPAAVEPVLARHPAVAEVAVVGRPDPEWGQRVVAVVVPTDPDRPPSLEQLRDWVKAQLPAHAAPTVLDLVDELPRTASGKVRRRDLAPG